MVVKALTKTGKWILYLLAALIILIALLVASVRLAVLYSDDNSEELASLVSSFVGSPVEIGDVDVVWNRFDASASLKDVQIRSADGAETLLELPQVELQLNVRDVLLERRLSVRNIQLSNLSLAASYEGRGQLRMFGRRLGRDAAGPDENPNQPELAQDSQQNPQQIGATGSGSALDWLFNAERISILDSEITLIDAMKDREYKIENVNIRAFNDDDLHQIRISSALPGETGDSSLASFDFTGDADNISDWKGEFYVNTGGLDIAELSDLWRTPQQDFAGTAELQLWGSWSGAKVTKLRAIASATDLYVQQPSASGTFNASLQADQVNLDLDWFRLDSGWQLTFNQLTGRLDNQDLEFSGLELQASHDAEEEYFSVAGPDIDLQALKPLKSYVDAMLPDDVPFRTHALRRGLLTDWRASGIVADNNKPTLTELRVNAVDLAIDPYDKIPGISNLTAAIAYDGEVGRIVIGNQDVSLSMPELYDNPLPSVNIEGVVDFLVATDTPNAVTKVVANAASNVTGSAAVTETATIDSSASSTLKWKAVTEDLRISSLDFDTSSIVSISGHSDGSQMIDLHTSILNANVARLQEYYPVRKIKPTLLNWLQTAIVGGDAVRGRVEVKGNLADFAPADGRGHFYAEADLVDATVKFEPDWPAATGMDGNVSFSTTSMRGRVYQGSIRQANFNDVRLLISDFSHPVIGVQASAIGPVADLLDFVQTGPLAPSIGGVFGESTGSGTTRFVLDLKVPLNDSLPDEIYVDGEVRLDNAQINSRAFGLDLDSVTGNVGFNRRGVTFDNVAVRYQGLPLDVSAVQTRGSDGDHNRIRVKGPMAAASVMHSMASR